MRVGYFAVPGGNGQQAQVTIIPLAGQAGGNLENVNRWRGQVGLARIDEAGMKSLAEAVQIAGGAGNLFDFAGATPDEGKKSRLLAAVLQREGTAWFFKMMGDDALVAAQKPKFIAFLKDVTFEAGASESVGAASVPPPALLSAPASVPAAEPALPAGHPTGPPAWTVPASWQSQTPGPMQLAKFAATNAEGGKADITVVALPGDAGGKLPNVNRWRGQIGLPPVEAAELEKRLIPLEVPGAQTYLVEMAAEATKRGMVAAGVSRGGQTWFYKLIGDAAVVSREKDTFIQFVKTVNYGP